MLRGIVEPDRLARLLSDASGGSARVDSVSGTIACIWLDVPGAAKPSGVIVSYDASDTPGILPGQGATTTLGMGPNDPSALAVLGALLALTGGHLTLNDKGPGTLWNEVQQAPQTAFAH